MLLFCLIFIDFSTLLFVYLSAKFELISTDKEETDWIKAMTERRIENTHKLNYEIILSLLELLNLNQKRYYRLGNVVTKLDDVKLKSILSKYETLLKKDNKIILDNLLVQNNKKKYYYRGIVGMIKRIFDR